MPFASTSIAVIALVALAAIAILAGATWAHLRYWTKKLELALDYADLVILDTPDGASIELRRVPIPATATKRDDLPPVLLVHGLAANHRNQDVHPDYSLARYLA